MEREPAPRLRLLDLDMLDARELERLLPQGSYALERRRLGPGEHGDLGLTAAIVALVSPPVIAAITMWLLKKRQRESIVLIVEKIAPDNSVERISLEVRSSNSEAPRDDVLRQIVEGLKLDSGIVAAIARGNAQSS